jgi:hypothetical protein
VGEGTAVPASRAGRAFWAAAATVGLVAIGLRVVQMVGYTPAILSYPDEGSYVQAAATQIFADQFRPAGYPVFLRFAHLVSGDLRFTIALQHLIGLGTAVLVYLIARRCGASRWVALVPATIAALSGDQLYTEHVLLSEALFTPLVVAGCYCALRFLDASYVHAGRLRVAGWLVVATVVIASLGLVRTVGVALVPVFVVWVLAVARGRWRRRAILAGSAALVSVAVLLSYAAAQERQTRVFGLTRSAGWSFYGRVGQFADCDRFTPPAGTAPLCRPVEAKDRYPSFYIWSSRSPGRRAFGKPPAHGKDVGRFARAALFHQPDSYLYAVVRDAAGYVKPGAIGDGWKALQLNARVRSIEAVNIPIASTYWHPTVVRLRAGLVDPLEQWRRIVRIHGLVILLAAGLAVAAPLLAQNRRERAAVFLVVAFAVVLFGGPVATSGVAVRYGLPAALMLVTAAARGGELLAGRLRSRRARAAQA